MRRITFLLCLCAAPLVLAAGRAEADGQDLQLERGTVWVTTNRALNNVAVFSAATGSVLATISVGRSPADVAVSECAGKAYATDDSPGEVRDESRRTRGR